MGGRPRIHFGDDDLATMRARSQELHKHGRTSTAGQNASQDSGGHNHC
jgi:hypothetical protein